MLCSIYYRRLSNIAVTKYENIYTYKNEYEILIYIYAKLVKLYLCIHSISEVIAFTE